MFKRVVVVVVLLAIAGGIGWAIYNRLQTMEEEQPREGGGGPAPVEVQRIEVAPIALRRTFSGTLEAPARFVVAPKVSGRVEQLTVDLADTVTRGQVIAELDNDEFVQAVNAAEAELAVAEANLAQAVSAAEIANRELQRIETLRERGVASESQLDTARSQQLAANAQVQVARAQVTRAEAALETARIRLGYTTVRADWTGSGDDRIVAERFVDTGDTVSANSPLVSIVDLTPMTGVIFVTEKDYGRLQVDQPVALKTDAYPDETFQGRITRIAPVFQVSSRQARVELTVDNEEQRLKPGMFIRSTVVLEQVDDATIVPAQAVTRRDDRDGVFLVNEQDMTVDWQPVDVGIRAGDRVQLLSSNLRGRVVTLGQQLIDDGSEIRIPDDAQRDAAHARAGSNAAAAARGASAE